MNLSLHRIAQLVKGELHGPGEIEVGGADILRNATATQITFAEKAESQAALDASAAAAALVSRHVAPEKKPYIVVDDVRTAFATIVTHFRKQWPSTQSGIAPEAYVSPSARIAPGVEVHPLAHISDEVTIGRGSVIHAGVRILPGCTIGENTILYPNVVLYENTVVGNHCLIHATAVIGAYGFGYNTVKGQHELCAQLGNVEIADHVEIGAGTTIDRGSYGSTVIGTGSKLDNQVMIGHNCIIGRHNLLCAHVGIAGSCTTGDYVVMAGQAGLRDHIHIGDQAVVGGKSGVKNSVPAGVRVFGTPAVSEREFMQSRVNQSRIPTMRKQIKQLMKQVAELQAALEKPNRSAAA